jgi:Flp pilus assembly protein TadG
MLSLKSIGCQRGQAVVETTLSFLFFMMVLYAIVEFSHLFYTKLNLQHAVSEAGRYMITGQGLDLSGTNPNARLTAVQNKFCQNLIATGLSCANIASHVTVTCVGGCSQPAGGPGQTVTLTVQFQKPWLTTFFNNIIPGPITLTSNTTWKNEPYM